ncbi:MAG: nitrile hydratase subunit alpha [Paracoccaceae bacterium]|jgi:nitrile hydratase|nr:MAG: nitrile hydratase subunit alpha [Paracoccaceae bacterium]|tara:strand:- start:374 stop:988 length:615 start_codon:yes stop_codon:yes gene_type:complete
MPHDVEKHSHSLLPSDPELKVKALETALVKRGLIDPAALDEIIDTYQNKIGPKNGATIIAKALLDKNFKKALIDDPMQILEKHGFLGRQGEHIKVVENTPEIHNIVVCTLCSCYPWPLLGIPPTWYKSDEYRSRVVREPRKCLSEFGVTLPKNTKVRVWDSTAEIRYLVLPILPDKYKDFDEEHLSEIISRDAMIGTALIGDPS